MLPRAVALAAAISEYVLYMSNGGCPGEGSIEDLEARAVVRQQGLKRMIAIDSRQRRRWANFAGLGIVVGLMSYALFAEHVLGLAACPLCVFQRMAFIALGVVFLAAAVHSPASAAARVYGLLGLTAATVGAVIAGRHVYIQNLPADQVPACGPGLDYIMDAFPLLQAVELVFTGSGECAEVNWSFLGVSMPGWAFIWFVLLAALFLFANWKRLST